MTVHSTHNIRIRIDLIAEQLAAAKNVIGSADTFEATSTLGLSDLEDIKDELEALIDEWKYGIVRMEPLRSTGE